MAEEVQIKNPLPIWTCKDLFPSKEVRTVGQVSTLMCEGGEPIEPGGVYSFKLDEKNEYALKILKVTEDTEYKKSFEIAPYVVAKGDLKLIFRRKDQDLFESVYRNYATTSVLTKNDTKPVPPQGPAFVLPSYTVMTFFALVVLLVLGLAIYRAFREFKKSAEYRRVVTKARYADPFMDFNVEVRELEKERKFSLIFIKRLDETFQKCFFRIFEDNVFFDAHDVFFRALKGLGVEPHEIRSFYVLEEEYRKFISLYKESEGKVQAQKSDFISLSKKTMGKLKKYKVEVD